MSEKYKFNDPDGIYFVTLTVVHWIDLFTRKELKYLIIENLIHCQNNRALVIHAWCIMPSHIHLIISSKESLSGIMRDFKKYTSRKIISTIQEINESRREWLLRGFKKAGEKLKRIQGHKVWKDGNQPKQLISNSFMQQKLDYIHHNPVEDGIVDEPEHYTYSSARDYAGSRGLIEISFIE